ncbi:GNAT family N-acetyltransferase [Gudongella sp. DL1XJH-153]|uniref:GNAT family N-acetyltransferase n=1 Tax=Gudongella sp. DL1XJH-153 TaxID=3409804 RepID=UPI003BB7B622
MRKEIEYKVLRAEEITREMFTNFIRHQKVTKCWRKIEGEWLMKDIEFVDDWSDKEYSLLSGYLKNTSKTGGIVIGVFHKDKLKGFASVESEFLGSDKEYLDLSSLHVSEDMRGHGIGKVLFEMSTTWAREKGAKKLYISAHSSVETQGFYRSVGCVEALEYNKEHVDKEPYDCQLEYVL